MSVLTSEAVVLRTWPVHEADLIVSFFTRDYGRLKGMAKAALDEYGIIGARHNLVGVAERNRGHDGTEDLLALNLHVVSGVHQRRSVSRNILLAQARAAHPGLAPA